MVEIIYFYFFREWKRLARLLASRSSHQTYQEFGSPFLASLGRTPRSCLESEVDTSQQYRGSFAFLGF